MESLLPFLVAAAAIGLMYFVCIRPMRRGQCGMMPQQQSEEAETEREEEIARLHAEIAELRRSQESPRSPSGTASDTAAGSPEDPR